MKKILYLLLFSIPILMSSSDDSASVDFYPILMERTELERSVFIRDVQDIVNPGKIYYKDNIIYLNEKFKGIHVIDNTNPSAPVNLGFINIPGCIDIAIKNNSLMADNAVDLVSIDLTNGILDLTVTRRVRNVFPEPTPPNLDFIPHIYNKTNRPDNTIIVGWEAVGLI